MTVTPLRVARRRPARDQAAAEDAAAAFLTALGVDVTSGPLADTPGRMARAYAELLTPREFQLTTFPNDEGMEYAGYAEPGWYDRVVFRGGPPEYVAFWVRDGRVLAGMNVNVWDVQDDIQRLVRAGYSGRAVDLDQLADPSVALGSLT